MISMLHELSPKTRGRLLLVFIAILFFGPMFLASVLTHTWRPMVPGAAAHGQLLTPAQPLPAFQLLSPFDEPWTKDKLFGLWTLAYIGKGQQCDALCQQQLYRIRQIRLALGKNLPRARTLYLANTVPDVEMQQWLQTEHQAMGVAVTEEPLLGFLASNFESGEVGGFVYLFDPVGNVLMRYNADIDPGDILDDLKRLMKLSSIG